MISLGTQLRRVRRRLLGIGTAAAAVWGLAAATILLLLRRVARPAVGVSAASGGSPRSGRPASAASCCWRAVGGDRCAPPAMPPSPGGSIGRARSAAESSPAGNWPRSVWSRRCGQPPRPLTLSLANMAVADAAAAAGQVPLGKVAPVRPLGRSLGAVALLWAAVAVLAICLPGLAQTQWNRFSRPFADVPPFSRTEFKVTPGNSRCVYGSELEIRATVIGPPVEQLELVLAIGQRPGAAAADVSRGRRRWRAVLAKVVEPTDYYVRAYRARSNRYHLSIITVPLIESARLRIEPPAYANRAAV